VRGEGRGGGRGGGAGLEGGAFAVHQVMSSHVAAASQRTSAQLTSSLVKPGLRRREA
jgi:hypothetical protein